MADKKKLPSTFFNMVVVLTAIALASALALGITYSATKDAIAMVEVKRTLKALNKVMPGFDNNPYEERYTLDDEEYEDMEFFPAKKGGQSVGTAVRTYSDNGFNERIWLMVGFSADLKINSISVIKHKETPGLGTKMKEPKFKDQFNGKDPAAFKLKVKKDGGDVDAISAATITSRAFCDATEKAYFALKEGKPALKQESEKPTTPGKTEETVKTEKTGSTKESPNSEENNDEGGKQ
jgi:electron transport complex protein RnfG